MVLKGLFHSFFRFYLPKSYILIFLLALLIFLMAMRIALLIHLHLVLQHPIAFQLFLTILNQFWVKK